MTIALINIQFYLKTQLDIQVQQYTCTKTMGSYLKGVSRWCFRILVHSLEVISESIDHENGIYRLPVTYRTKSRFCKT